MSEHDGEFEFVEDEKKPLTVQHENHKGVGAKHRLYFNERGEIDEEKLIFDIRQAEHHIRRKARKSNARRALKAFLKFVKLVIVIALLYYLVGSLQRWLNQTSRGYQPRTFEKQALECQTATCDHLYEQPPRHLEGVYRNIRQQAPHLRD